MEIYISSHIPTMVGDNSPCVMIFIGDNSPSKHPVGSSKTLGQVVGIVGLGDIGLRWGAEAGLGPVEVDVMYNYIYIYLYI